jgi:Mg/Co/Ni transporter MgtE (contains CBS domain)
LVGIITVDDILDIVEEEATEDFHKNGCYAVARREILPFRGLEACFRKSCVAVCIDTGIYYLRKDTPTIHRDTQFHNYPGLFLSLC